MIQFYNYLKIKNMTIDEYINLQQYNDILPDELVNCNCCNRHKLNFPIKIELNKNLSNKLDCKCPCRHISRYFCRLNQNMIQSDSESDSEWIGSETSTRSEESETESETQSDDSFIEKDSGMSDIVKKALHQALINLK